MIDELQRLTRDQIDIIVSTRRHQPIAALVSADAAARQACATGIKNWMNITAACVNAGNRGFAAAYADSARKTGDAMDLSTIMAVVEETTMAVLARGSLSKAQFEVLTVSLETAVPGITKTDDEGIAATVERRRAEERAAYEADRPTAASKRPEPVRVRLPKSPAAKPGTAVSADDLAALKAAMADDDEDEDDGWGEDEVIDNKTVATEVKDREKGTQVIIREQMQGFLIFAAGNPFNSLHKEFLTEEAAYSLVSEREWVVVEGTPNSTESKAKVKKDPAAKFVPISEERNPAAPVPAPGFDGPLPEDDEDFGWE